MISTSLRRWKAKKVGWALINTPYRWAGDDPMKGFDCSGLCIEMLRSVALLPRKGDWTANDLAHMFPEAQIMKSGCLVFWLSSNGQRYRHVEFCLDSELSLGASGGGSTTTTEAAAVKSNAYVKVRPVRYPSKIVDPFAMKPYWWENR